MTKDVAWQNNGRKWHHSVKVCGLHRLAVNVAQKKRFDFVDSKRIMRMVDKFVHITPDIQYVTGANKYCK